MNGFGRAASWSGAEFFKEGEFIGWISRFLIVNRWLKTVDKKAFPAKIEK